jgi:hypothetical protein
MKQSLPFVFFLFVVLGLQAQITINNSNFPVAGDTLLLAIDNLPSGIEITPAGGSQTWDFTTLQSPFTTQTVYKDANEGDFAANFPSADLVAQTNEVGELYYHVSNDIFELVGFAGEDPAGFGVEVATQFDPPYTERRAPLNFFDVNQTESALLVPFAAEDIPGDIFDGLPVTPDSIRIRVAIDLLDVVDAWGTLTIPGGIYDVLREKRTEIRETRVDIKVGFFSWTDVTDILLAGAGPPLTDFLGADTTITYNFLSDEAKEPIAVVSTENDGETVTQVQFKSNDITSDVKVISEVKPGVYAYPNPAIVNVRFEFSNLDPGDYQLKIINILGVEVWSQKYQISGNRTERVNISFLRKGTYLYSLVNEDGKTLTTKRLIVIRP